MKFVVVMAAAVLLSSCSFLFNRPLHTDTQHDPSRVLCGAVGMIHWREDDKKETVAQIKAHNATRRGLCPADRYEEWYYDGDPTPQDLPALVGPAPIGS